MRRLLSFLFVAGLLLAFAVAGRAAGADQKFIYEADLFEPPISTTPVNVSYAHVTVDPTYNVNFEIKTNQKNSRLGMTMMEGPPPFRHSVYIGDVPTGDDGEGKAVFNLKDPSIDYQIVGPAVGEPSFRLFSYQSETGVPPAMEASTVLPVYSVPVGPTDNGTISIQKVLPDGYAGEVPWFDLSWRQDPFYGTPVTFTNLVPRYYAITRCEPQFTAWPLVFDKVVVNDPNADSFILGQPPTGQTDRTVIVNLAPGQTVTVTYYYKYK